MAQFFKNGTVVKVEVFSWS